MLRKHYISKIWLKYKLLLLLFRIDGAEIIIFEMNIFFHGEIKFSTRKNAFCVDSGQQFSPPQWVWSQWSRHALSPLLRPSIKAQISEVHCYCAVPDPSDRTESHKKMVETRKNYHLHPVLTSTKLQFFSISHKIHANRSAYTKLLHLKSFS